MVVCYLFIAILLLGCIILVIRCYRLSQKLKHPDNKINELESKIETYKDEISHLNKILDEFRSIVKEHHDLIALISSFNERPSMTEQIDDLEQFIGNLHRFSDVKVAKFFARIRKSEKAFELVKMLQRNVTIPFFNQMQSQDVVSDTDVKENIAAIIDAAMKMMDVIESLDYVNYRNQEQSINVRLVKGEINRDKAIELAKIMTKLSDETPAWARTIKTSVEHLELEDQQIIFSGYKLK